MYINIKNAKEYECGYDFYTVPETGERIAINHDSGEVRQAVIIETPAGSIFYTPAQQEAYRKRKQADEEQRIIDAMLKMKQDELGNFYFASAGHDFEALSPANLARLFFLCTYLRYNDSVLRLTERKLLTKKDLPDILHVSKNTAASFLVGVDQYLSVLDNESLSLSSNYFHRGTLPRRPHLAYRQVYISALRKLYNQTSTSKHRYLGYIFKMIPLLNIEHNILCWNPEEKDFDFVNALNLLDFCQMIDYRVDHISRLREEYERITFDVNGHKEKLCSFIADGSKLCNTKIIINPRIIFSGKDYAHVEKLGMFSRIKR